MKQRIQAAVCAGLAAGFLLGASSGRLALWQDGDALPLKVYPCAISCLPVEDQAALNAGIPITDSRELARLLEDFLS